jgi:hypothetical protein
MGSGLFRRGAVPEPATLGLAGLGLLAASAGRRRRRSHPRVSKGFRSDVLGNATSGRQFTELRVD